MYIRKIIISKTMAFMLVFLMIFNLAVAAGPASRIYAGSEVYELVYNRGFESGSLTPWVMNDGTYAIVNNNQRSGNYSIKVTAPDSGWNGGFYQIINNLLPNTAYAFSAWGKVEDTGDYMGIGVTDFGGSQTAWTVTSTSYSEVFFSFTTGPESTSAKIFAWLGEDSGTGYIDDYSVIGPTTDETIIGGEEEVENPGQGEEPGSEDPQAGQLEGWDLIFQDEFSGAEVNTDKWNIEDVPSPRNNELQWYKPDDVYIEDGNLVLRSQERDFTYTSEGQERTLNYTSGSVTTLGKFHMLYGKAEVRAKLPTGRGIWPAIWLNSANSWPPEFDILEVLGHEPNVLHTNNHWGLWPDNGQAGADYTGLIDYSEDYHVYGFEWDPGAIRWYLDGEMIRTYTNDGKLYKNGKAFDAIGNTQMYLYLNTAVGGDWPGDPDETTVFPQYYLIDYVRVYERAAGSKVPVNIARNKTVTADSENYGREAYRAADGNSDTLWIPRLTGDSHWLQVDLGETRAVTGAAITWDEGRDIGYIIEASADGDNWQVIADRTAGARPEQPTITDSFDTPVTARYLKVTVYGTQVGIREISIYDGTLTDPPSPRSAEEAREPLTAWTDDYSDWDFGQVIAKSDNWTLRDDVPENFGGDTLRAMRWEDTRGYLVYRADNMHSIVLRAFEHNNAAAAGIAAGKVKFYISPDTEDWTYETADWTEIPVTVTNAGSTSGWNEMLIKSQGKLPEAARYIKIEVQPYGEYEEWLNWTLQLSKLTIIQDNMALDELDTVNGANVFAKSGNWSLLSDSPEQFSGDGGRWGRSNSETAHIIYQYQDIHDICINLFSNNAPDAAESGKLKVYRSSDNRSWTEISLTAEISTAPGSGWNQVRYIPAGEFPAKSDYLKIELSGADFTAYQLSSIEIHYGIPQEGEEPDAVLPGPPLLSAAADKGTPVIDGVIDSVWNDTEVFVTSRWKTDQVGPATAEVRTLWDEEALYVLADVTDPHLGAYEEWNADCIEIYVDEDNSKASPYDSNDFQYRVNYRGELSADTRLEARAVLTDHGYLVEARIPFKNITAAQGRTIGFDIQVSDDPGAGYRQYIASWNSTDEQQSKSMFTIGDLILGPAKTEDTPQPPEAPGPIPGPIPAAEPSPGATPAPVPAKTMISASELEKAIEAGGDYAVSVKGQDGQEIYSWTFTGKNLLKADKSALKDINLKLDIRTVEDNDHIKQLLNKGGRNPSGLIVEFEHDGVLPVQAAVRIYVGSFGFEKNDKVYLYHYNPQMNKLETLPYSNHYKVDKDGYITVNIVHCSDYAVLKEEADPGSYTTIKYQVVMSPSGLELYTGSDNYSSGLIEAALPATLELVEELGDETGGSAVGAVTITYKSSNEKVAAVSQDGAVNAKSAGTAKITALIKLYNGKSRTFTTTVTVKEPGVEILKGTAAMKQGETFVFEAEATGYDKTDIIWMTTKRDVVIINKKTGKAVAKTKGTDYIEAIVGDKKASIKVTVK